MCNAKSGIGVNFCSKLERNNMLDNENLVVCDSVMKNLITCKKAGLSMLVTGNVSTEIKLDLLKKLIVSDKDKKTVYIKKELKIASKNLTETALNVKPKYITIGEINEVKNVEDIKIVPKRQSVIPVISAYYGNGRIADSNEMKKATNTALKLKPNTVFYPEIYSEDILDIIFILTTGHQLLTSIAASNEMTALYRIATCCLDKKGNFSIQALNSSFDLIINIGKYHLDEQNPYKIFSISIPAIEGEKIKVKRIVEYDNIEGIYVLKNDVPELKEKVLRRTGLELGSWI